MRFFGLELVLLASLKPEYTYRALVDDQSNLAGFDRGPALAKVVPEVMAKMHVVRRIIVAIALVGLAYKKVELPRL